ncbi:MAG: cupin domain-containing protein [Roseiflexaceae bacterium]
MALDNMPEDGTRQLHPPDVREAARHDARGEGERANREGTALGNAAPRPVITNPISGEQIVIHTSGAETDGKLLVFDLFLPPGKHVPSRHTHPIQEERFTILAGTMRFRLGWWHHILATPSDTIVIPPGVARWFGNAGSEVVHARVEVRPALRTEALFVTVATIEAGEHRSIHYWVRQLSAFARLLIEFQREVAVPDLAAWLVRPALAVIARIGHRSAHADMAESHHGRS